MQGEYLNFRESVKHAIAAKSESVKTDTGSKTPGTSNHTLSVFIQQLLNRGIGHSWMNVNRHIQFLNDTPKGIVFRLIVQLEGDILPSM
jgi:hypothetical protein